MKQEIEKPDNLIVVASSPYLNMVLKLDVPYVDHVFTVFEKDYIKKNDIVINCGADSCMLFQKCYEKYGNFNISEQLR